MVHQLERATHVQKIHLRLKDKLIHRTPHPTITGLAEIDGIQCRGDLSVKNIHDTIERHVIAQRFHTLFYKRPVVWNTFTGEDDGIQAR
jgi:hypothetical protein